MKKYTKEIQMQRWHLVLIKQTATGQGLLMCHSVLIKIRKSEYSTDSKKLYAATFIYYIAQIDFHWNNRGIRKDSVNIQVYRRSAVCHHLIGKSLGHTGKNILH